MNFEFHPEALEEYQEASRYYAERNPQLVARRFIQSVEAAIGRIVDAPERWRIIDEDLRRCLTRVIPYGILYTIETDNVLVVVVMHCSREPGYWKSRISSS
jgi:toxin ParE1/3/4